MSPFPQIQQTKTTTSRNTKTKNGGGGSPQFSAFRFGWGAQLVWGGGTKRKGHFCPEIHICPFFLWFLPVGSLFFQTWGEQFAPNKEKKKTKKKQTGGGAPSPGSPPSPGKPKKRPRVGQPRTCARGSRTCGVPGAGNQNILGGGGQGAPAGRGGRGKKKTFGCWVQASPGIRCRMKLFRVFFENWSEQGVWVGMMLILAG